MTNSFIAVRTKKDISVIEEEKEKPLSFNKIFPDKNTLPNENEIPPVEQLKEMIKAGKKQKKLAVFKDKHGTVINCAYLLEAVTHTDSNIYFSKDNASALIYTAGNNLEYIMCPIRDDGSMRYGFNFIAK